MSDLLDGHRLFLSDRPRIDAFRRAIHTTIRPGDIVIDLGCGTGILGLMACEAGAARVYAIDGSGMIEIARAIARANGFAERIVHVAGHSADITLPERADALVFDQIGRLGFDAGLLDFGVDARRRLLKPGAAIVPGPVVLHFAAASSPVMRANIDFWRGTPAGIDASAALPTALNSGYPSNPEDIELLSEAAPSMTLDAATWNDETLSSRIRLRASRSGTADGLAGWFVADLAPGVTMTNAPDAPHRINRRFAFLPFSHPIDLAAGEELVATLRLLPTENVLAWDVSRADGRDRMSHSTWKGMLPVADFLHQTAEDAVPVLTPRGRARGTVLALCDGRRPVAAIERALLEAHPDLFASSRDAAVFAAEVLSVYAKA